MREILVLGALALTTGLVPVAALADDPNDPTMRTAAARARDRAIIRRLNQNELAYVRERDARYAAQNRAGRADHERDMADYARRRRDYQERMTAWREAVAACRSGVRSACD